MALELRIASRLASVLLAVFTAPVLAAPAGEAPVRVEYVDAAKFSDIGDSRFVEDKSREAHLQELRGHFIRQGKLRLAQGQVLDIVVTDVDLAGQFEPGRRGSDPRIVKDIYPPRIDLSFKLVGADGAVVKSGDRKLRNAAFLSGRNTHRNEPLAYEKALIDSWFDRDLPR